MSGKINMAELSAWFPSMSKETHDTAVSMRLQIWTRIEADREAVRAETREDVLEDHFKIGEIAQYKSATQGEWNNVRIVGQTLNDLLLVKLGSHHLIRRPAKKRQMTRKEKVLALRDFGTLMNLDMLKDSTIDDLCACARIPTEVEE